MEAKTKKEPTSLISTISIEEIARVLSSGGWRITGSIALIKKLYGLPKDALTPERPLIKSASFAKSLLTISLDQKNLRLHEDWVKIERPLLKMITITIIKEVPQEKSLKEGGGIHLVRQLGAQYVIEKH